MCGLEKGFVSRQEVAQQKCQQAIEHAALLSEDWQRVGVNMNGRVARTTTNTKYGLQWTISQSMTRWKHGILSDGDEPMRRKKNLFSRGTRRSDFLHPDIDNRPFPCFCCCAPADVSPWFNCMRYMLPLYSFRLLAIDSQTHIGRTRSNKIALDNWISLALYVRGSYIFLFFFHSIFSGLKLMDRKWKISTYWLLCDDAIKWISSENLSIFVIIMTNNL